MPPPQTALINSSGEFTPGLFALHRVIYARDTASWCDVYSGSEGEPLRVSAGESGLHGKDVMEEKKKKGKGSLPKVSQAKEMSSKCHLNMLWPFGCFRCVKLCAGCVTGI